MVVAACMLVGFTGTAAADCNGLSSDIKSCVTSISPVAGPAGSAVTIQGLHFKTLLTTGFDSYDITIESISFAGVFVDSFTIVNDTQIIAMLGTPLSGSFPVGPVVVKTSVATGSGCTPVACSNNTAQGAVNFQYTSAMSMVATSSAVTQIGALYSQANTVTGGVGPFTFSKNSGNFPPGATLNTSTGLVSGTLIAPAGPFSYSVKAVDQFGQTISAGTAGSTLPPTLVSVSPAQGPSAGGQSIIINGSDFGGATSVTIDGVPVAFSVLVPSTPGPNRTQIAVTTQPHAPGPVSIVVTTLAGTGTGTGLFTYLPSPTITAITPASGPLIGGQTVVITGSNFDTAPGTTFVTFGGVAATAVVVNSSAQITATTPANVAGPQTVAVTTTNGTVGAVNGYTYQDVPTVTSVNPPSGPTGGGQTVTITGQNFAGATGVTIGGTAATIVGVPTATTITATTPPHATGTVNVVVTTPSGTATGANLYTYADPPTVTAVNAPGGPLAGGTTVTISGANFINVTSVTFDGVAATGVIVAGATSITARTPAHAAGTVNVVVTTPAGTGTGANLYTYAGGPIALAISPPTGPTAGGQTVTISGQNFIGATAVSIGGSAAAIVGVPTATTITVTTPPHTTGLVDVVVTTPGGTLTGTSIYRYVPALTLASTAAATQQVGQVYSQSNVASGGTPGYTYAVTGGALPGGTILTASTGLVFGAPTASGTFSYTITASDSSVPPLTAAQTITGNIIVIVSTSTLASSLNPSLLGQPVTFSATITPTVATGTVTFRDGATVLCNAVPVAGGVANCTLPFTTAGGHPITAAYSGSPAFAPSTSAVLVQTVNDQRLKTVETIGKFMSRRNDLIMGNAPDMSRQVDRLIDADGDSSSGPAPSGFTGGGARTPSLGTSGASSRLGAGPDAGDLSRMRFGLRERSQLVSPDGNPFPTQSGVGAQFGNDGAWPAGGGSVMTGPIRMTGNSDGAMRLGFSTSLRDFTRYTATEEARKAGEAGAGYTAWQGSVTKPRFNPFDIWVEGKYTSFRDSGATTIQGNALDGQFGLITVGADYVLNRSVLVGVMGQLDIMSQRSHREGTEASGRGWMAGPYATLRLTDNLFLQARGAWGQSSNEVSPFLTYTDKFESVRWLASTTLMGRWTHEAWSFRPSASVAYMEDLAKSYRDNFGIVIPEVRAQLGQAKAGPEFGYRWQYSSNLTIEPRVAMQAIWNFAGTTMVQGLGVINGQNAGPEGVRGRVEIGQRATTSSGVAVDMSGSYDGIGSKGYEAYSARAQVHLPLQ